MLSILPAIPLVVLLIGIFEVSEEFVATFTENLFFVTSPVLVFVTVIYMSPVEGVIYIRQNKRRQGRLDTEVD